jgi:hypothetical protein
LSLEETLALRKTRMILFIVVGMAMKLAATEFVNVIDL